MARLNEPPVSTDNVETLRRKFMRQNREIARINSTQSQRIRNLENECARLLSENLELRSQILRLEKELQDDSARRVADHAAEIKAKMEAQLAELGSLLATFGLEPPAKRLSLAGRRISKPRPSMSRTSPQQQQRRRPRASARDLDALTGQEGRLPPIHEGKPYPRQTLNGAEILALCSEAADTTTDSPDLGPPPVSRYVDADPVKVDSPSRVTGRREEEIDDDGGAEEFAALRPRNHLPLPPVSLAGDRHEGSEPEKKRSNQQPREVIAETLEVQPVAQLLKAARKRKFGVTDENEVSRGLRGLDDKPAIAPVNRSGGSGNGDSENAIPLREVKSRKSIKDLPASRRSQSALSGRKPLASKSTNEDMSSPRKVSSQAPLLKDGGIVVKQEPVDDSGITKDRPRERKKIMVVDVPNPPPPPLPQPPARADVVIPEPEPVREHELEPITPHLPAEAGLLSPITPVRSSAPPRGELHDTPPPADISSCGETSRPSRRARASISYAEPNLRDKMRRPTKELFDAVAGEGKYIQRHQKPGEQQPQQAGEAVPGSARGKSAEPGGLEEAAVERQEGAGAGSRAHKLSPPATQQQHQHEGISVSVSSTLPSTVTTERRKRASSIGPRDSGALHAKPEAPSSSADTVAAAAAEKTKAAPPPPTPEPEPELAGRDPYEFTASSPSSESRGGGEEEEPNEEARAPPPPPSARSRGGPGGARRRASSAITAAASATNSSGGGGGGGGAAARDEAPPEHHHRPPGRPPGSRKRASMVAPKKSSMLDGDDSDEDSSYEPPRGVSSSSGGGGNRAGGGGGQGAGAGTGTGTGTESGVAARILARDRISRRRSMML